MKVSDPRVFAANAVSTRPGKPATAMVHDSDDARLVVFRLAAGEEVPRHTSPSTVILSILEGSGTVLGPDSEHAVEAGAIITYETNEVHGMRATDGPFTVLATITPRPGTR